MQLYNGNYILYINFNVEKTQSKQLNISMEKWEIRIFFRNII